MILKLMPNSIDTINLLIKDYFIFEINKLYKNEEDFNNKLKKDLLSKDCNAYYYVDDHNTVSGLVISKIERNININGFVSFLYMKNSFNNKDKKNLRDDIEKNLIEQVISELKSLSDFIEIKIKMSDFSIEFLLSQGFSKIPRANMIISLENIHRIPEPKVDTNYSIISFENIWIKETAKLIVETNKEELDSQIFPEFTNIISAEKMIKDFISNKYGIFENKYSSLIAKDGILIGYCFITIIDKTSGFILDIGITPKFRGKGLGKYLITNSLLNLLKINPDVNQVELAVTLLNKPAINLYQKLGFKFNRYADVLIWNK
ncbi:MAG: GNAT family N-acetyltransferase [Candidatus Hodarchaeales archaeon]|jgi:GNAT superfamily N-acetyltransferase